VFATAAYAAAAVFSLRPAIARPSLHGSNSNPLKPPLSRFCAPLIPNTLNHETLASTIRRAWSPSAPPAMREWHKLASARVSTGEQNPEAQLFALREYASRRRFSIFKEYVDHVSGHVERRRAKRRNDRAYRELMEDASRRSFDCVLVWKYDRFARSLSILVTALQQFSTLGIDFISYIQNIDTTTAMGASLLSRDRDDRRARSSGPRKCPCKGQSLGRPKDRTAELRILALRKQGLSLGRLHTARSGQPPVCAKSSAAPPCLEDSIE
jgi:hypothetical protein